MQARLVVKQKRPDTAHNFESIWRRSEEVNKFQYEKRQSTQIVMCKDKITVQRMDDDINLKSPK